MRRAPAPLLFLLGLLSVAAVAGATVGVVALLDAGDDEAGPAAPSSTAAGPGSTTTAPAGVLATDQVEVTGLANGVDVEGVRFDPVLLPLDVSTPERGLGAGARIEDVTVDGRPATITWDAGRPLLLRSDSGAVLPGLVNVYLGQGTATLGFPEGAVHGIGEGAYSIESPVAVSLGAGLAQARDSVRFDATAASTVSFTGGAFAPIPVVERTFTGPGRVALRGAFTIRRPDGSTSETLGVELPEGAFELTVVPLPDGGGWEVTALLQGGINVT